VVYRPRVRVQTTCSNRIAMPCHRAGMRTRPDKWVGMGDWLGTGRVADQLRRYRSFDEARAFVHGLGLKSTVEWREYYTSGKKPDDIPAKPDNTYADAGWAGYGDWLGTRTVAPHLRVYRSFDEARAFVHGLGLKSSAEWFNYCRSGNKPADIPRNPNTAFSDSWAGYGDWLGTGTVATHLREYRSFEEARAFVRSLGLKSQGEWLDYCKSGKKPVDIPVKPYKTYANAGWAGEGDWLGTGRIATHLRKYRSFEQARAFVRGLELKSETEWRNYCKSGQKPDDIPAAPFRIYAEAGWAGMSDWLGTATKPRNVPWRSFGDARAYVHGLKLESLTEWLTYCKSGKKPNDIPSNPQQVYAQLGWAGTADWLGYSSNR